jgi:3-hydroxybutyryl-CoA dehydratase
MENDFHGRTAFEIGERARMCKEVTEDDIVSFGRITGDCNPVHIDPDFASKTRFKGRIAHGMLSAGLISAVLGTKLPGPGSIYLSQNLRFVHPVRIGDMLTAEVEVTNWNPTKRIIRLNTHCFNQVGEDVVTGKAVLLVQGPQL